VSGSLNLSPKDTVQLHDLIAAQLLAFEKPKIVFHIHNSPPLDPVRSHMNPIHALRNYLFTIHLNITLPSTPRSSNSLVLYPSYQIYTQHSLQKCWRHTIRQTSSISVSNVKSAQTTNLIIRQVTPTVSHWHTLTSQYSPQHPLLKCPQRTLRVENSSYEHKQTQILGYAIKMFHKQ